MAKEGTLLIVDDNRSILAALRLLLEKYFARVLTLPTPNRLATTLREEQIDVNTTGGVLRIRGARLALMAMTAEELRIGGEIAAVEWVR